MIFSWLFYLSFINPIMGHILISFQSRQSSNFALYGSLEQKRLIDVAISNAQFNFCLHMIGM